MHNKKKGRTNKTYHFLKVTKQTKACDDDDDDDDDCDDDNDDQDEVGVQLLTQSVKVATFVFMSSMVSLFSATTISSE